jgi:hypothetical protein
LYCFRRKKIITIRKHTSNSTLWELPKEHSHTLSRAEEFTERRRPEEEEAVSNKDPITAEDLYV